jgi:hypothetical protein
VTAVNNVLFWNRERFGIPCVRLGRSDARPGRRLGLELTGLYPGCADELQ